MVITLPSSPKIEKNERAKFHKKINASIKVAETRNGTDFNVVVLEERWSICLRVNTNTSEYIIMPNAYVYTVPH